MKKMIKVILCSLTFLFGIQPAVHAMNLNNIKTFCVDSYKTVKPYVSFDNAVQGAVAVGFGCFVAYVGYSLWKSRNNYIESIQDPYSIEQDERAYDGYGVDSYNLNRFEDNNTDPYEDVCNKLLLLIDAINHEDYSYIIEKCDDYKYQLKTIKLAFREFNKQELIDLIEQYRESFIAFCSFIAHFESTLNGKPAYVFAKQSDALQSYLKTELGYTR